MRISFSFTGRNGLPQLSDFKKRERINRRKWSLHEERSHLFVPYLFLSFFPATEVSAEQQRAAVHQRLSVAADEIFKILEIVIGEVSGSRDETERHRQLLDITSKTETNIHTSGILHIARIIPL